MGYEGHCVSMCVYCGGAALVVASIEETTAILAHFAKHGALEDAHYRPAARAARCGGYSRKPRPSPTPNGRGKAREACRSNRYVDQRTFPAFHAFNNDS